MTTSPFGKTLRVYSSGRTTGAGCSHADTTAMHASHVTTRPDETPEIRIRLGSGGSRLLECLTAPRDECNIAGPPPRGRSVATPVVEAAGTAVRRRTD